jgi:vancomycin resistance protein VanJ
MAARIVERKSMGFWGWLVAIAAVGYPLALLLIILALRLIGERWWVTTVGLYLPRLGFGLPLPVLVVVLLLSGRRRLLLSQVVALALLLFPLMGLRYSGSPTATPGAFHLRVLSYNIASGGYGVDNILAQVTTAQADVIVMQESAKADVAALKAGLTGYTFQADGQFIIASHFPIEETFIPPRLLHDGKLRSPRFIRYRLTTPKGPVQFYSVHPISPRDGLDEVRGSGLRHELVSGRIFRGEAAGQVVDNAALRLAQLQEIAEDARRSPYPLIIAGDTNSPPLSWAFAHFFGIYQDGFTAVGSGFGYTFPAPRHPWMRIDRVLVGPDFRFLSFAVARSRASDHYAVVADIERR